MITSFNILKYLDSSISYKEKDNIVNKNLSIFQNALNKLSNKELVTYFLNIKASKQIKKVIAKIIDKRDIKEEIYDLLNNYPFKKIDITKNYYPKIIKRYIISKLDIISELTKNTSSIYKEEIILNMSDDKIVLVLEVITDATLIDLILKHRLNTEILLSILNNTYISEYIKEKIIENNITNNNILFILSNVTSIDIINKILEKKLSVLENKIKSLSTNDISNILKSNDTYPQVFYECLNTYKEKEIDLICKTLTPKELGLVLKRVKNETLASKIISKNSLKTKLALKYLNISPLSWIYNDYISNDIKEFIITKKSKELKSEILKRSIINLKLCYLKNKSNIPLSVIKLIIELRKNDFLLDIKKKPQNIIISEILYGHLHLEYKKLLIEYGINKNNLFELLNKVDDTLREVIIDAKKESIIELLNNLDIKDFVTLDFINNKEEIINSFKELYYNRLKLEHVSVLYSLLSDKTTNRTVKKIILNIMNISEFDLDNCVDLIKYEDINLVIKNYNSIKDFINSSDIGIDSFIQYGSGTSTYKNWFTNILSIISNNKKEDFLLVFNFIKSLYKEESKNLVNTINIYLLSLEAFINYESFLKDLIASKVVLTNEDISNLKYLFTFSDKCNITSFDDIKNIKQSVYNHYKEQIKKDISINELKKVFNNLIFKNTKLQLSYIGGVSTLIDLKKKNEDSSEFQIIIDKLIKYARLIEIVNDTNNKEALKNILDYLLNKNIEGLKVLEDSYLNFRSDIRKMLELDALINLSNLESSEAKSLINEELTKKYGAVVYDFRGVNYCLYAHVLSRFENASDLVNGNSNSSKNFLSVSPISYLGQKYYFDRTSLTFAISSIPKDSFICSSLENMSTNYSIKNNSSEVKETYRTERGILETSAVTKNNAEVLLFRENVKASGIILPGGREPTEEEIMIQKEFNLPFIITQNIMETTKNTKKVFNKNKV